MQAMREGTHTHRLVLTLIAAALSFASSAQAKAPLDPAFGEEGGFTVTPDAGGVVTDLAEDRRGRLVAGGISDSGIVLARYRPNGTLDPSFTGGPLPSPGVVRSESDGGAYGVAVQRDGKIVAAGADRSLDESSGIVLARYLPDGRRDRTFGRRGMVHTRLGRLGGAGLAMALQAGGRILVGGFVGPLPGFELGNPSGLLIRYLPDGSIDRSFSGNGQVRIRTRQRRSVAITDLVVLAGGKILAAGTYGGRFLLVRLLPDGSYDPSFGRDGKVTTRPIRGNFCGECSSTAGLALAKDGEIFLAGSSGGLSALIAYSATGSIDRDFGDQGLVMLKRRTYLDTARDVIVTRDGRIVVVGGSVDRPGVLRFLPDGRLDRSFAGGGVFRRSFRAISQAGVVIQQPNGRLVVGGRADPAPPLELTGFDLSTAQFLLYGLRP
jgi:uncharacterized delta-60 repeat protein